MLQLGSNAPLFWESPNAMPSQEPKQRYTSILCSIHGGVDEGQDLNREEVRELNVDRDYIVQNQLWSSSELPQGYLLHLDGTHPYSVLEWLSPYKKQWNSPSTLRFLMAQWLVATGHQEDQKLLFSSLFSSFHKKRWK